MDSNRPHVWDADQPTARYNFMHVSTASPYSFFLPFSLSPLPGNQKTRRGKSVLRPNHTLWPNLSTNSGRFPTSVASPCSACQAHSILTTDSSCRRKCPPIANSSEVHSLAGGSFQQVAWERKN